MIRTKRIVPDRELDAQPAPLRPKWRLQRHIVTADFRINCRQCGADIDALHVHDLVVYCADCCPACGGNGDREFV